MRGTPVFPNSEVRRRRSLQALGGLHGHSWARRVNGRGFRCTLSNQRMRFVNGHEVMTVEASAVVDGLVIYEDQINFPNPALMVGHGGSIRPVEALQATIEAIVHITTKGFTKPRLERNPDGSYRGDTLDVRADIDGRVQSSNGTFATMCTGSGLATDTTSASLFATWNLFIGTYTGRMFFMRFPTNTLGAGAVVTAAVYTMYANGTAENDTNGYDAEIRYKNFGDTVENADWFDPRSGVWSGLVSGGVLDVGSWNQTAGTGNSFSDSGVYSSIGLTDYTRVVLGMSGMDNATPTGLNSIDFYTRNRTGTTEDPQLTVTYHPTTATKDHHYRQMRAA